MIHTIENRILNNQFVLIAEVGVNYYDIATMLKISPMDAAKRMIDEAVSAGIHAVKFQTYKAETLASKDSPYYWDITEEPTDSQYKLFKKFDSFGYAEYKELALYCEECGIEFLSTAFDIESADYLDELMNVYKISSSDLNNLDFIEYQAKKEKMILLSIGAANEDEIVRAINTIRKYNNKTIVLLHCVLEYPTPYEHANLRKIASLKEKFGDCVIGYSDHTKPSDTCDVQKLAYGLGAQVIEKHYTLNKALKGNDHYHAMNPYDAKNILSNIDSIEKILGDGQLICLKTEEKARKNARRSLVARCDIPAGAVLNRDMITWKRPGTGIAVDRLEEFVGRKVKTDISEDTVLQESYFD